MGGASDDSLQLWRSRTAQLEAALRKSGHLELQVAITAIGRLLEALAGVPADERASAIDLVSRSFRAIRAALTAPGTPLDESVVADLDRMRQRLEGVPSEREALAPGAGEDMRGFLDAIGNADDDDLGSLAASVKRMQAAVPRDELGTLREPLASIKTTSRDAAVRVLMKGELSPGLLADLIQLFAQNAETGLLAIEGDGISASIYLKDGKISDATCGDETGEKAFFRTMLVRQGRFSYQRGVETTSTRIFRSAQHLIMETLRLMDESA